MLKNIKLNLYIFYPERFFKLNKGIYINKKSAEAPFSSQFTA